MTITFLTHASRALPKSHWAFEDHPAVAFRASTCELGGTLHLSSPLSFFFPCSSTGNLHTV